MTSWLRSPPSGTPEGGFIRPRRHLALNWRFRLVVAHLRFSNASLFFSGPWAERWEERESYHQHQSLRGQVRSCQVERWKLDSQGPAQGGPARSLQCRLSLDAEQEMDRLLPQWPWPLPKRGNASRETARSESIASASLRWITDIQGLRSARNQLVNVCPAVK